MLRSGSIAALVSAALSACATPPAAPRARAPAPYCTWGKGAVIRTTPLAFQPKYFFKPAGRGPEVTLAGSLERDQNLLVNLDTGAAIPIPGRLDPIGLFGEDLVSIPIEDRDGRLALGFYDLRELRAQGENTKPLLAADAAMNGRYQSLGVLSKNGAQVAFRVLTDGMGGGQYRDYRADFSVTPARLSPMGPRPTPLCSNFRPDGSLRYKLPMLSKDGRRFAAFDLEKQEMKVFRIEGTRCAEEPLAEAQRGDIGKVDFSPGGGGEIAFHYSDRSTDISPLLFDRPTPSWHLRSAVYSVRSREFRLLPFFGPGTNTYFPAFLPNGHLLTLVEEGNRFSFVEIDPAALPSARALPAPGAAAADAAWSREGLTKLAQFWGQECTDARDAIQLRKFWVQLKSLPREQCEQLVRDSGLSLSAGGCSR